MADRTFAIGDIHGDLNQLEILLKRLPKLDSRDTLLFLGDYIDRGPQSFEVVERLRALPERTEAHVVTLRGNHEDAWLRVIARGWKEFVNPPGNGCIACFQSYSRQPNAAMSDPTTLETGGFFPSDHVDWMRRLPYFYEDDHAIYVHAGLSQKDGRWLHPDEEAQPAALLWVRSNAFFQGYRGKPVVFGHTVTGTLPPDLSSYTPDDPTDLWASECLYALDTGCGKGGFLTALELPRLVVYESRG